MSSHVSDKHKHQCTNARLLQHIYYHGGLIFVMELLISWLLTFCNGFILAMDNLIRLFEDVTVFRGIL